MAERFVDASIQNGFNTEIVQKTFSRELEEVGKVSLSKIAKVPGFFRRVADAVSCSRPTLCIYFITVGLPSLLVDCMAIRILRRRQIPYVLYFHGKGYRRYEERRYSTVSRIIRNALGHASGGLVLGECLKHDVDHCISNDRLYVLPNGIPDVEAYKRVCRRGNKEPIKVIFLANLIPSKGPMTFIAMARKILESEEWVRFVLAGRPASSEYFRQIQAFIESSGLENRVELPGPLYGEAKERLFGEADIFVLPTEKDVFPLVNLEAMQWSLPVVSSPIGAIPEIVRDGVDGFIVDPKNVDLLARRVVELVRNSELRRGMGHSARTRYEAQYSLTAYARNLKRAMDRFLLPEATKGYPVGRG
ncbi:glycosyltransferase family 4 protein [Methylocaldum marinum]|nr:glycosyltransferase family 4 protein [Methylocaldum marinum]